MITKKKVNVILREQAKESYLKLKKQSDKEAKSILKSIERVIELLKQNPQFGNPIKKSLIPEQFRQQGIQNLYRVELSKFWRMLYALEGSTVEIFVFILTITDHKQYDKLWGYKKK